VKRKETLSDRDFEENEDHEAGQNGGLSDDIYKVSAKTMEWKEKRDTTSEPGNEVPCTEGCVQHFKKCEAWWIYREEKTEQEAFQMCRSELDTEHWKMKRAGCKRWCVLNKELTPEPTPQPTPKPMLELTLAAAQHRSLPDSRPLPQGSDDEHGAGKLMGLILVNETTGWGCGRDQPCSGSPSWCECAFPFNSWCWCDPKNLYCTSWCGYSEERPGHKKK